MERKSGWNRWIWWFSLIGASVLLFASAGSDKGVWAGIMDFVGIFTPFIIAFVITFLLYAPCNKLELAIKRSKFAFVRRAARPTAMIVCYVAFFAILSGVVMLLLPALYDAVASFIKNLPVYYADISERLQTLLNENEFLQRYNLDETIRNIYEQAYAWLLSFANTDVLLSAFRGIITVTSSLVDVIMALIVSVYMLAEREALLGAVKKLLSAIFNDKQLALCGNYAHSTAIIFYKYLYGALVDAVVVSVIMAVGLSIFGLPKAVLLGCMIGILNFIPYFGAIFGCMIAIVVALFTKNIYTAIGVAVYVVVMQQLDGNVLQPKIVGSSVGMRPIYVLLAITIGGGLFGFWGILVSVPVLAVVKMLLTDFIAYRKAKRQELS